MARVMARVRFRIRVSVRLLQCVLELAGQHLVTEWG